MPKKPCPPHHWLIAPAAGPTSEGICCRCGARRMFKNSRPDGRHLSRRERQAIKELIGYMPSLYDDQVTRYPWRKRE